jgi:hypothetical protein
VLESVPSQTNVCGVGCIAGVREENENHFAHGVGERAHRLPFSYVIHIYQDHGPFSCITCITLRWTDVFRLHDHPTHTMPEHLRYPLNGDYPR